MANLTTNPWHLFMAIAPYSRRILLHSETPGTGKTSAAVMLAKAQNAHLTVVTCSESLTASDLLGHWVPKGSHFEWHHGPVGRAILAGKHGNSLVVLNELDHAGPDVQQTAYGLLETGDAAQMTLPSGEVLHIPPTLTILATMNPDPKDVLTPALLNRFQCIINLESHVSPMILDALPRGMSGMVRDGRMGSREAFALLDLTDKGCDPMHAVHAVLGRERADDYGDALAIALAPNAGDEAGDALEALTATPVRSRDDEDDEDDECDRDEDDE
jgi:hypothetical protein